MRQDPVWLKKKREVSLQDRDKKTELSTVTDNAEKVKGKRPGFHCKELTFR